MTKHAFSLMIALIFPIVMFCGCSSEQKKQLTLGEYKAAMESAWDKYLNSMLDFIDLIPLEENEESVRTLGENADKAKPVLEMRRQCLDDFKAIVPPEKYEELHQSLIESEDAWEYRQLELYGELFKVTSLDELKAVNLQFKEREEKLSETETGMPFTTVYLMIKAKLESEFPETENTENAVSQ